MPTELKDFVVNLKSLSQDIEDPIIQGGDDANGRALRIIFTQEAADMFTPDTKVYLYWNHQQLKTYGVNVFTRVSKNECCFNPPVWEIHWPKAMLHEGDVLCCIKLVDDISISPSNNFLVHVLQDPNDGSSFVVGDDYSVFDKAVIEMNVATNKAKEQLQEQQEEFESMRQEFTTLKDDVQTAAIAAAKSYTDQEVAKKANLEHTHEIDNVTGLQDALDGKANIVHTHATAQVDGLDTALAGKADKATTLAEYGITDAYTKGETDSAIATAVAVAPHLKRSIVEQLPEEEEADENTIYMVPQGGSVEDPGTSTSHYNEYMLINGAFELIGSSQVDLSGYATETFVTGAINALDVADTAVTNQYVSQVVETDGKIAVTRVPLPVTSVTEGSANGTIAVNGADANVHGLGSAAYTESSAYEVAGTAAAAVAALDKEDSAQAGQYVSAVSQENGIITIQRAALPTASKITTGGTNGTIKVGEEEVAVAGLKSAAYTEASAYATAAQGALADSAVQEVAEGTTNGTILVDGTSVAVHGFGSAAYTETSAYATATQGTKADQVFAALTWQEG